MKTTQVLIETQRIDARGVIAARRISARLRTRVLKAFRRKDFIDVSGILKHDMLDLVADARTYAHLIGMRASREAAPVKAFSIFDRSIKAISKLTKTPAKKLRERYGHEVGQVLEAVGLAMESKLRKAVLEINKQQLHVQQGVVRLGKEFDKLGISPNSSYQLETIFRTQSAVGYSAGRWEADQDPDIQEILWGYEYVTVEDDRVRPEHEALNGTKLPKEDPFWQKFWPPNGWNCRCVALPIYNEEAPKKSTPPPEETEEGNPVRPDPGFGFNAGTIFTS